MKYFSLKILFNDAQRDCVKNDFWAKNTFLFAKNKKLSTN